MTHFSFRAECAHDVEKMKRRIAIPIICIVAVLAVGTPLAIKLGHVVGEQAGLHSKERLQLVWPSIMDMPVNDRVLLVGLAMTCHVEDRPAVAGDVVECLRDALDKPQVMLPKGIDRDGARARFDQLLRQRSA
jgi:hypothetical protein